MSVDGFLRGFKRFMARRGIPDMIINDNFKTFKSAEVKKFMLLQGITQRFILPASPWWGGFYERLVRTVKTCLKKTLGRAFVTFEELQTVLCEIEVAINNRPLAYVSDDDLDEALTPFHLMHGRNVGKRTKPGDFIFPTSVVQCKRRLFHVRKVLKDFWARFRGSYLSELRQMNIYRKSKSKNVRSIAVGDVALIRDDEPVPRTQWRMGKILRLVKGLDGQIRGAQLKVLSKAGKQTTVFRPVQKLIPFEICENENNEENATDDAQLLELPEEPEDESLNEEVKTHDGPESGKRKKRKAAIEGQNLRRLRERFS
ncbi:uncharacterized protein LOC114530797 [Dendronephthya gigantea]|uniref:uncharacterized protein LOC114530797 n=1 Tax=Dendronephthya gigantea TaxID=151771 RepID=UPI001069C980|nr:uncharacterized protein LOC114530797 [Dendronephthya gigantea]